MDPLVFRFILAKLELFRRVSEIQFKSLWDVQKEKTKTPRFPRLLLLPALAYFAFSNFSIFQVTKLVVNW